MTVEETKKEHFRRIFHIAIEHSDYIAVAVETRGNKELEIIINPRSNFKEKEAYYEKAYNDDMVLNTYDGIRIVSACPLDKDSNFGSIVKTLQERL